ncbi:hypothetical protein [Nocardioides sp.]|uniref:hypothetical protein n=1 Tax=Nocardioides sp. TaxID=35761 RepID=UPI00262E57AE|nr:hypothetical protein [Nocardioides sp.]
MIDTEEPNSPGWWLKYLSGKLHDRRAGRSGAQRYNRRGLKPSKVRPGLELLDDYLRGDPPLREDIHRDWAPEFREHCRIGRLNVAPRIVSATTNRMGLRDFRTAAANDELGDEKARDLMRHNQLRLRARQVHDDMLGLGDAYTIITPPDGTRSWSLITAETPLECITEDDPATGEVLAGLKMFRNEPLGIDYAYLFLPGALYVAFCEVPTSTLFAGRKPFVLADRWDWDFDKFDTIPNNRVAMVHFENKNGRSEIEGHLEHLDRINDRIFNEWWTSKIQAFRQRALEMAEEDPGEYDDDPDATDEDGRPLDPTKWSDDDWAGMFTSAPDALWRLPKGAKIWESAQVDNQGAINAIKSDLQWLAFTAAMPLYLITPDAANGSAEGASTQKEEHTFEIGDRRDRAEARWAQTIALAFEFQSDTQRADVSKIEAIWGPMQLFSLQEMSAAANNLRGVLPTEAIWTDVLQMSPGDVVDRIRELRNRDLLFPGGDTASAPSPTTDAGATQASA